MSDPLERFLDAAVAPLDDNAELQLAAREQLQSIVPPSAADDPELPAATERLERTDGDRKAKLLRIILIAATLLLSAYPLIVNACALWRGREWANSIGSLGSGSSGSSDLFRGMSAETTRLLMGGKELWDSAPDNPLYFADYAIYYVRNHDTLPPNFLETAKKLDPDNSWFTTYAAGVTAVDSVKAKSQTPAQRKAREAKVYTVEDAANMKRALELLHEAAQQKSFSSPQSGLMELRAQAMPPETDSMIRFINSAYVAGQPAASIKLRALSEVVSTQAAILESSGDVAGLKTLMSDWETILSAWLTEPKLSLIDALVLKAGLAMNARQFAKSAAAVGLHEEAARWQKIDDILKAAREERDKSSTKSDEFTKRMKQRGSLLASLSLPVIWKQVDDPPPISDADLQAMRLADHELVSRGAAIAVWAILALMMLAACLYHLRGDLIARRLSRRVETLLRPIDWIWIIGLGAVLPVLWQQFILRLTPFSGSSWSLGGTQFMVPTGAFTALAWLIILAPVAVARWRLGLRVGFMGMARPRAWSTWLGAGCAALAIPALGWAWGSGDTASQTGLALVGILLLIAQLVWLITGIRALSGSREELLRRVSLSRAVIPAYAAGMLLMAALIPFFHAQEQKWISRDSVMQVAPERASMTAFEAKVAGQMQQELKDLLAPQ